MVNLLASWLYPTKNVSLLEIVRVCLGLVGIGASISLVYRSYYDLVYLWKSGSNSWREYSAKTSVRLHGSLLAVQLLILGINLIATTQPRPMGSSTPTIISSSLFITTIVLLTIMALETDKRKRNLIEKIEKGSSVT